MSRTIRLTENQFHSFLIETLYSILTEGVDTIQNIYQKYYSNIPNGIFTQIIQSDPTYSVDKPDKMGKYGKWLLNLYRKGNLKIEDLYKAKEYLTYFSKYINKIETKDINKFQTLPQLYKTVEPFMTADKNNQRMATSKSDEIRQLKKDVKKVYEDSDWLILIPLTREAAIYYGKNTQWCTAAERSSNYYDTYTKEGPLYININKKDNRKYQFHFESGQFMDEFDDEIENPIASTIGMSPQVVRKAYSSQYATLMFDSGDIALGNNIYLHKHVQLYCLNDNGLFSGEYGEFTKRVIAKFDKAVYFEDDAIIKLDRDYMWIQCQAGQGYGGFLNLRTKQFVIDNTYQWLSSYQKQDGSVAIYGKIKDKPFIGIFEDGEIRVIAHFKNGRGFFGILGANEGEIAPDEEGTKRYITISKGYEKIDTNVNEFEIFDVYDLETNRVVLTNVTWDTTIASDNEHLISLVTDKDEKIYRWYIALRDPITDEQVDERIMDKYDYSNMEDAYEDSAYIDWEEAVDECRNMAQKYRVFEDNGEIQKL